jgi:ubiquinone/menaquinone biosynthesis C-methylase UbiE
MQTEDGEKHASPAQIHGLVERKTEVIAGLILPRLTRPVSRTLVVGCGSGIEAAILSSALNTHVIGIDVKAHFDPTACKLVELRVEDATRLSFGNESFDFVYSYHALEHIPEYRQALREMRRVLVPDGSYCVGTPNRLRLIGYLGSKTASTREKIQWNLLDWQARLHGRFRNEFGAHAGFSKRELGAILREHLGPSEDITFEYYLNLYKRRARWVKALEYSGVSRFLFPSVYFFGSKESAH